MKDDIHIWRFKFEDYRCMTSIKCVGYKIYKFNDDKESESESKKNKKNVKKKYDSYDEESESESKKNKKIVKKKYDSDDEESE